MRRRGAVPFVFAALLLFWFHRGEPSWAGVLLVCAGEGLRLWAAGHLRKDEVLTTGGPYAFVRNPLYIGSLTIAIGFTLMLRSLLLLVPLLAGFALAYRAETRREEKALRQKFGTAFDQYRQAVPPWIPYLPRYPEGSQEPFRWRRVLRNREYNAVFGILLLFLAVDLLDDVLAPWLGEGKPLGEVLARYLRHLRP
ncbi:MAG: methyltransferase family protein [Candidatus Methylomirabilales bacterium]